jgi:hypothetical protein
VRIGPDEIPADEFLAIVLLEEEHGMLDRERMHRES